MNLFKEFKMAFQKYFKADKITTPSKKTKSYNGPEGNSRKNENIKSKIQGMKDSQGKTDFSGSSYNGPGNVDHEKTNSNMSQRNF